MIRKRIVKDSFKTIVNSLLPPHAISLFTMADEPFTLCGEDYARLATLEKDDLDEEMKLLRPSDNERNFLQKGVTVAGFTGFYCLRDQFKML